MSLAVLITNIILTIVMVLAGVALLADMAKDSRPIIIKEAKALREYYEGKLKELQEKTAKAEEKQDEYRGLYEHELQENGDASSIKSEKLFLEMKVESLTKELNSCEDRINDMAQENASLKERIKALKESAPKKPAKKKEEK